MSGPRRLGDVLSKVLARYQYGQTTARSELENVWREAAGPIVSPRTKVGGLRYGTLDILVDNAVLLQELEGFQKNDLLKKMTAKLEQNVVKKLRFRRM